MLSVVDGKNGTLKSCKSLMNNSTRSMPDKYRESMSAALYPLPHKQVPRLITADVTPLILDTYLGRYYIYSPTGHKLRI